MSNTLYQEDFYAWTQQQAAKLRAGLGAGLDFENIAESAFPATNPFSLAQALDKAYWPD